MGDTLPLSDAEGLPLALRVLVPVRPHDVDGVGVQLVLHVPLGLALGLSDMLRLMLQLGVGLALTLPLPLGVPLTEGLPDLLGETLGLGLPDNDEDRLWLPLPDGLPLHDGVLLGDSEPLPVRLPDRLRARRIACEDDWAMPCEPLDIVFFFVLAYNEEEGRTAQTWLPAPHHA